MIKELQNWPQKLQDGIDLAEDFYREHGAALPKNIKKIAFFGMGGSGVAGRIIKTIIEKKSSLPLFVFDGPDVPPIIDTDTLAIVVSYSGNTWETIEALNTLTERYIPLIVVSHGGKALQIAQNKNLLSVIVPQTGAPRAALGYFLGFILNLFDSLGIHPGKKVLADFEHQIEIILPKFEDKTFFNEFLYATNHQFATFHIWGVTGDTDSIAYRGQTQFNENSKMPIVSATIPELCHNLLVGFSKPPEKQLIVLFYTDFLLPKLQTTVDVVREILHEKGCVLYKAPVFGDTWESQLISLILWADFASVYLGQDRGVQIKETPIIDELKEKTSKRFKK